MNFEINGYRSYMMKIIEMEHILNKIGRSTIMNMDILICIMLLRYSLKIKNGVGFYGIEMDSILRNNLIPWYR